MFPLKTLNTTFGSNLKRKEDVVEAEKKRNKYYKRCQECLKKEN
jgi:hypothetical protein